ncbi:MAG TPA: hypothetical protein VK689_17425, partial [Armatimonadota bacterium]|nr:hypothetical protein [Armatimonadota bacterium]
MTRTLAVYLLVLLAAGCWGVCGAQVGPSRENVKRVAPAVSRPPRRKPQARPRPVAPRRAAPVPRITRRPPVRRAPRTVTARPPRPRPQTVRRTSPPARREAPVARRTPPVDPAVAARLQAARQWLAGEGDAAEAT